jgi:hypothetical protein
LDLTLNQASPFDRFAGEHPLTRSNAGEIAPSLQR